MLRSLKALCRILLILCAAVANSNVAIANDAAGQDDPQANEADPDQGIWKMNLAVFARYGPSYPASENNQFNIVPLPYPQYSGKILKIGDRDDKPISTRLFERDNIKLDIKFGLNFPVDSDEVDARTGMPDLDFLIEAGPELELKFARGPANGDLFFSPQLRAALSFDGLDSTWRGLVFGTELKYETPFTKDRSFKIRLTPEWGSNDYMDFFYGVAPEYGIPVRTPYEARSGYLGTKLIFSLRRKLRDDFEIRAGVRFGFYQGARNSDSPLYTAETNAGIYGAVLWKFWESKPTAQ
jgi:outer membrane protein